MAGIGFELRNLLKRDTLLHTAGAYLYAAVIGSGAWVLSIVGMLLIGLLSVAWVTPASEVSQFQVSITWIIAGSLILTGGLQLNLTRYVADRCFAEEFDAILPNLHGTMCVTFGLVAAIGLPLLPWLFPDQGPVFRLLFLLAFGEMCAIWLLTTLLSGLKRYKSIVAVFALGYGSTVLLALVLRPFGLTGLLAGFTAGHALMLLTLWGLLLKNYPLPRLVSFDLLRRSRMYASLLAIGVCFNLAVWADKLVFWLSDTTGAPVIGLLRASALYDLPVFLAYLSIIPGMAIFLVRIETDFAEYYTSFYNAVREGASLSQIREAKEGMVLSARQGLEEIAKIQGLAVLALLAMGEPLMQWLGLSTLFLPLLQVQAVAAAMQVMVMAVINVLFYLDERLLVFWLCLELLVINTLLSAWSITIGPSFYGYGFALALLITLLHGVYLLDRRFRKLEYRTFMLQ
jgi:polysaccharide biosynthesis protein PelG